MKREKISRRAIKSRFRRHPRSHPVRQSNGQRSLGVYRPTQVARERTASWTATGFASDMHLTEHACERIYVTYIRDAQTEALFVLDGSRDRRAAEARQGPHRSQRVGSDPVSRQPVARSR